MKKRINKKESNRNLSLDILRIISMLMIITLHFCTFGFEIRNTDMIYNTSKKLWLLYALCYSAVNLYVLISGYFLVDSKFKWKKVIKLWIQVLFYSIGIGLIFYFINPELFDNKINYIKIFNPIHTRLYWFITTYLVLYIISPYINKFIKNLTKKEYKKLIIILGIIFVICNNLIPGYNIIDSTGGYGILWFIYLYLVAGYIKLHDFPKINNIWYLLIYLVACILTTISRFSIEQYNITSTIIDIPYRYLYYYNSITIFISSVSLFMFFKNINIKIPFSKLISRISVATFGVYLIHEHFFIRNILYKDILKIGYYTGNKYHFLILLGQLLLVFSICVIIDILRDYLFKFIGYIFNKVKQKLKKD